MGLPWSGTDRPNPRPGLRRLQARPGSTEPAHTIPLTIFVIGRLPSSPERSPSTATTSRWSPTSPTAAPPGFTRSGRATASTTPAPNTPQCRSATSKRRSVRSVRPTRSPSPRRLRRGPHRDVGPHLDRRLQPAIPLPMIADGPPAQRAPRRPTALSPASWPRLHARRILTLRRATGVRRVLSGHRDAHSRTRSQNRRLCCTHGAGLDTSLLRSTMNM